MSTTTSARPALDVDRAWTLLLELGDRACRGEPVEGPLGFGIDEGRAVRVPTDAADLVIDPRAPRGWSAPGAAAVPEDAAQILDLYVPLCVGPPSRGLVVGHLGQSLDGRIATNSGVSQFITGRENVEHSHRMRALFDAVLVGARTVEEDDPRLTTRLVPGEHATRVVLDPRRRLGLDFNLFRDDTAETVLLCAASAAGESRHGTAEVVPLETSGGELSVGEILAALRRRGLRRIFIEGGGVTVSRFLEAGALDRLHVAVAPVVLGSGRPAFSLPVIDTLDDALVFECRHFVTGPDVLFDCAVRPRGDD